MSETGAGSDVMGMACRAERRGDYYLVNGGKMWITNGPDANLILLYARTGTKGISAFLVERVNSLIIVIIIVIIMLIIVRAWKAFRLVKSWINWG